MVVVSADPEVGLEQVVGAALVGDPGAADVDAAPEQATLLGVGDRLARARHLDLAQLLRPVDGGEVQVDRRRVAVEALDRTDRRDRVQPGPDPAAPDQDPVVVADRGQRPQVRLGGRRPLVGKPRRDHVDQRPQRGVGVDHRRVEQPVAGQHPQPQVALALRGADDEVGAGEVGDRVRGDHGGPAALRAPAATAVAFRGLDHDRVVEVGDVAGLEPREGVQQVRRQPLGDDDVVITGGGEQALVVLGGGVEQGDRGFVERALGRRHGHLTAGRGDRSRQLQAADPGASHALADRLPADEQDPGHRDPRSRARSSPASR